MKSGVQQANTYKENHREGVSNHPLISHPDKYDEAFIETANTVLADATELMRQLVPSHQSAIALIIEKDWQTVRKFFSLSKKYEQWKHYAAPAKGYGIHSYLLDFNQPIRLTQAELEVHPHWKGFGTEAKYHPPMRGWLVVPLLDSKGINWGLMQLSDRQRGEYTQNDEDVMVDFARLVSIALEEAWAKRTLLKQSASSEPP